MFAFGGNGFLRIAVCHLWTDEMLPVVANGRMFSIHAAKGGEKISAYRLSVRRWLIHFPAK